MKRFRRAQALGIDIAIPPKNLDDLLSDSERIRVAAA
jgi:hypothetical protein